MKSVLALALSVLSCCAAPCAAQTMGTLSGNGVLMDIAGVVAVFDASRPSLRVVLLPFQPTADEIAKLQAGDVGWLDDKPSPDTKKWKNWCPYGWFQLSWAFQKQAVGDAKKATLFIYSNGLGSRGYSLNANQNGATVDVSLAGTVKEGQEITLNSTGSESFETGKLTWALKVKAKVLTLKPR
jgi:hypothetical protein